jgi:hypothetical protein
MFGIKRPCPDCPFRTDIPGYLRGCRARDIIDTLLADDWQTFPCHKTTTEEEGEDGGPVISTANAQQCAGSLLLLHTLGHINVPTRLALRSGVIDFDELDTSAPVAASREAFIVHHALGWDERDLPLAAELLRGLLARYADAPTECDGHTQLVGHALTVAGIPFHAWGGRLRRGDSVISPHLWVTVGAGQPGDVTCITIDYRRQMWLGPDVAEGVLMAEALGDTSYQADHEIALGRLDEAILWALTLTVDNIAELFAQQRRDEA